LEAQLIDNLEDYAVELEKKLQTVRRYWATSFFHCPFTFT